MNTSFRSEAIKLRAAIYLTAGLLMIGLAFPNGALFVAPVLLIMSYWQYGNARVALAEDVEAAAAVIKQSEAPAPAPQT
jgi:hypothetical protein